MSLTWEMSRRNNQIIWEIKVSVGFLLRTWWRLIEKKVCRRSDVSRRLPRSRSLLIQGKSNLQNRFVRCPPTNLQACITRMRLQKDKLEQVEVRRAPDGGYEVASGGGGDSPEGDSRGCHEDLPQHDRSRLRQQQSTEIRNGHRRSLLRVRLFTLHSFYDY